MMNGKTKTALIVLITLIASAIVMGILLYPIMANKGIAPKEEQTTDSTDNTREEDAEKTPAKDTEKSNPNAAPDFTVYDINGNKTSLSDKKGKPVILNFWATWCPPCVGELPHFDSMYKKYGDKLEFMMVNLTDGHDETETKVKSFIDKNGYTFPVYLDSDINAAVTYRISSIPLTVFINADGTIANSKVGAMNEETLEGYIKNLLGE